MQPVGCVLQHQCQGFRQAAAATLSLAVQAVLLQEGH